MILGMVSILVEHVDFSLLGTKNVAKNMQKITVGPKKRERLGFPNYLIKVSYYVCLCICTDCILVNIGKSVKTLLYWTMKNCGGDAKYLRQLIMNISKHYQVCVYT